VNEKLALINGIDLDKALDGVQKICNHAKESPAFRERGELIEKELYAAHDRVMETMALGSMSDFQNAMVALTVVNECAVMMALELVASYLAQL
jgi:hypothetical protein